MQEIGRELGADYVLESSLRRDGDRVRITIQLVRTADQVQVWASSYDRQVSGSIALQEELAREVAARIEVKLSPEETKEGLEPEWVQRFRRRRRRCYLKFQRGRRLLPSAIGKRNCPELPVRSQ